MQWSYERASCAPCACTLPAGVTDGMHACAAACALAAGRSTRCVSAGSSIFASGELLPVTPHHGATGSGFGRPREGAWPPPGLELTPFSLLPMCCSHAWITHSWSQVLLCVHCGARSRPRPDRPRHGHRRRCRRRCRRRRHSPRVRLIRLRSSRNCLRVTDVGWACRVASCQWPWGGLGRLLPGQARPGRYPQSCLGRLRP